MSKSADFDMDLNEAAEALVEYQKKLDLLFAYWGMDTIQMQLDVRCEIARRAKEIY